MNYHLLFDTVFYPFSWSSYSFYPTVNVCLAGREHCGEADTCINEFILSFEFYLRKYKKSLISQSFKNKSLRSCVLNQSTNKWQEINLLSIRGYVSLLHQLMMDVCASYPCVYRMYGSKCPVHTFYLSTESKADWARTKYILVNVNFFLVLLPMILPLS